MGLLPGPATRVARDRFSLLIAVLAIGVAAAYADHAAVLTRNTRDFALTPVRLVTY